MGRSARANLHTFVLCSVYTRTENFPLVKVLGFPLDRWLSFIYVLVYALYQSTYAAMNDSRRKDKRRRYRLCNELGNDNVTRRHGQ